MSATNAANNAAELDDADDSNAKRTCAGPAVTSDGNLEFAEHVIQAEPKVVALLPPADDQRAIECLRPGGELLWSRAGYDDGARRHSTAMLDGLRPGDVDHRHGRSQRDVRSKHRTLADMHAFG